VSSAGNITIKLDVCRRSPVSRLRSYWRIMPSDSNFLQTRIMVRRDLPTSSAILPLASHDLPMSLQLYCANKSRTARSVSFNSGLRLCMRTVSFNCSIVLNIIWHSFLSAHKQEHTFG